MDPDPQSKNKKFGSGINHSGSATLIKTKQKTLLFPFQFTEIGVDPLPLFGNVVKSRFFLCLPLLILTWWMLPPLYTSITHFRQLTLPRPSEGRSGHTDVIKYKKSNNTREKKCFNLVLYNMFRWPGCKQNPMQPVQVIIFLPESIGEA